VTATVSVLPITIHHYNKRHSKDRQTAYHYPIAAAGAQYLLDQKKGGETQENEKTPAIGNSRDQHAGARGRIAT
jgi:hypothetical protein